MHTIKTQEYLFALNGHGVLHGPIDNNKTITDTGQPFVVVADTESSVIELLFETYSINPDTRKVTGTMRPFDWLTSYTLKQAQDACVIFNSISKQAQVLPIKHPNSNEYALPIQEYIFNMLPSGKAKKTMSDVITQKGKAGKKVSSQEMVREKWFK